jgi:peptide/nickel transport system permease protein
MRSSTLTKINWPLSFGLLIVLLISVIALFGQWLAPLDPTKTTFIAQSYAGVWTKPPFAAFTIPGYWFGSDVQGRDLLSQLLWAVRPTMLMVVTVAAVRLGLGTAIGITSAWSAGRLARWLEVLIAAALAIPVLIVALAVIAIVGIESGVLAFIVGLSLSGWGETARLVREQTRIIKEQLYIEAGRAIGETETEIISRHVLRQLLPVLGMLFAFEISATLLTTATLGFLGYYLGGGVWFQVEDFVAQRIAGTPELGQMLAIAAESRNRPALCYF